jgi:hypothetical protein
VSIPEFPGQLDEFIKGVPAARISQTSKFGDVGFRFPALLVGRVARIEPMVDSDN